ncbi:hypothetical protein ASE01_20865 [Nocardioides sp. Root190]|nr:hypothetical protein ASE01_20865 [Nocardioides sp. Root190]
MMTAALAGCAEETGGKVDDNPPAGSNAGSEDESEDVVEEEPTEAETSEAPENPAFGTAFTWENGLSVTVSKTKPFKPSDSAMAGKGTHISFTITVVNGTGANYDPSCDSFSLQSGNEEAEQIFDSAKGLEGSPSTTLLDGREAKYQVGFSVTDPNDLVFEFSPCDYELSAAIFVGP